MPRLIYIHVDLDACQACQCCRAIQACRPKAIVQPDPGEPPYLDIERCRGCQICLPSCPYGAVRRISNGSTPSY